MNPESKSEATPGDALETNVERLLKTANAPGREPAAPRMSAEARDRVLTNLLAAQAKRSKSAGTVARIRPRLTPARAAAVAGVIAIAAGTFLWLRPETPELAAITYENPGPAPREIALRDGSRATLDSGAVLVERAPRDLQLVKGEAIFDVRGEKSRFSVETKQGRADALGTRFWVHAADDASTVAVAKGRVELAGAKGEPAILRAGEQGTLRGGKPETSPAPRISHLFSFARATEPAAATDAPQRKGTLTGRDPRWRREEPLDLRSFDVDVHVEDGFARTTIDQTYFNARSRQLEGIYAFPVPEGAALSRLAMYVDGELMEGSVVGRDRGRDIYEGIVEQRRDPALLEWMSGNTFRMRVFPLPARTEKRIFMSYTKPLDHLYGEDRLVVPIPTVDQAASRASFRVRVVDGASLDIESPSHAVTITHDGSDSLVTFQADQYQLGQDLVLTLESNALADDAARTFVDGSERYVMVRHAPDLRAAPGADAAGAPWARGEGARRIVVLFDVSASRAAEDLEAQSRFVDGLMDSFDEGDEVVVVAVGHEAEVMAGGPVAASQLDREKVGAFLRSHAEGVGDTRLDRALEAAVRELDGASGGKEIVYVGDGVHVGASGGPRGPARAADLARIVAGKARFIGVGIGESVDRGFLEKLADATDGIATVVGEDEDLAHRAFDLVASTYTPCLNRIEAEAIDASGRPVEGAMVTPASRRVCDGERVEIVGREGAAGAKIHAVRVRGTIGETVWEKELKLDGASSRAGYLPRLFAERRVAALLADEPPGPGRAESPHAEEITKLATKHFLVTPFTSLLVLENDAMYKEFGVEKKAASGWALYQAPQKIPVRYEPVNGAIATSGDWDVLDRSPIELFYSGYSEDAIGLGLIGAIGHGGGLGLRGSGVGGGGRGQGFGSGSGRLGGSHRDEAATKRTTTEALRQDRQLARMSGKRRGGPAVPMATDMPISGEAMFEAGFIAQGFTADLVTDAFNDVPLSRLSHNGDPALDDLTELVPSLFTLPVDRIGDFVSLSANKGSIDPAAREALERAAASVQSGTVRAGTRLVTVSGAGRVELSRRTEAALRERAVLDVDKLVFEYEELGIRASRTVGAGTPWWLASEAPWVPPRVDSLEGLVVESLGARSIRIRPVQAPRADEGIRIPALEIEFDDVGRVVRVVHVDGPSRRVTSIEHGTDSMTVVAPDGSRTVFETSAPETPAASEWAEVDMPLSNPTRWEAIIEADPAGRDAPHAHRQLLATYAALQDGGNLTKNLDALRKLGKARRGDVALASRGLRSDWSGDQLDLLRKEDPLRDYLAAQTRPWDARGASFGKVGDKHPGTMLGMLATYRAVLAESERGAAPGSVAKKVRALHDRYPEARFFRYAAVTRAAERMRWMDESVARSLWQDLVADPVLGLLAERKLVDYAMYKEEDRKATADRAARAVETALARGLAFKLNWQLRYAVQRGHGQVGLDLLMARFRSHVLERGTAEQVLGLLRTVTDAQGGALPTHMVDVGALLRRLDELPSVSNDTRMLVARTLYVAQRLPEAKLALRPVVNQPDPPLTALELAAAVAEAEGDLSGAAGLLDRLLRGTQDMPIDLAVVRTWYSRLVELHLRRAGIATATSAADAAVTDALAVARRWRREDADNPAIDELCATALYRMGRPKEALEQASSIVERRPAEGASWGALGTLLTQQGDTSAAILAFEEASRVEPTNPTWLVSHAQALLARGKSEDRPAAKAMLEKVAKEKWQDRYFQVTNDAKALLALETK